MVNYYDELEIEDFAWDPTANVFHYPCPCGDRFEISKSQLRDGEEIAICPSCSLIVRVIYDYLDWEDYASSAEEDEDAEEDAQAESPNTSASPTPAPPKIDESASALGERTLNVDAPTNAGDQLAEEVGRMRLMDKDKEKGDGGDQGVAQKDTGESQE